jgi:hypothetical protein
MQKILIGIMTALTLVLGLLCAVQAKQLRAARTQLRAVEEVRAMEAEAHQAQAERVKELERDNRSLDRQVSRFATVTTELRTNQSAQTKDLQAMAERIRAAQSAGGAEGEGKEDFGKGMGDMLGKMMKDPAMRDMIREQQKAAINMMYGGLFKDLNLNADEKEKLKGILTEAQMKNVENAQSLFGGDKDASKDQMQKQMAESKTQSDAEIKALLGPERFAQYEDYQKNINERMQIDQFKNQLAGESYPLQDQQAAQLMEAMKNLKNTMPPPISSDQTQTPKPDMFTEDKINGQIKWMDEYNRQLVDAARPILTPEQLKPYQAFLEQQSSMQKLGLKMAKQMFGGNGAGSPSSTPAR